MQPSIILDAYDGGRHNVDGSADRLRRSGLYRDVSTVQLVPTRGRIPARVVACWQNLMAPMNQQFFRLWATGYEVGNAYSAMIDMILAHEDMSKFKYVLTLEEDNMPPPDGLLRLVEALEENPQFDAVGGLYWTKGEEGMPMIYGDPKDIPFNFRPQVPRSDEIVECNGLGMGFTLFRLDMFKDERIPRPFFETVQRVGVRGWEQYTQDLKFFENAKLAGHRVAVHCGVRVGHYDDDNDIVW